MPFTRVQRRIIATDQRPTGRVTFLFTDIEGSTRLLQRLGGDYPLTLAQHHRLMRRAIGDAGGTEVKTEGDSFFVIFPDAPSGVRAAVEAQQLLANADWPQEQAPTVRMGLHTGDVELSEGEYVGVELHRAARISAVAHGGQVVISAALREALGADLPPGTDLVDLGEHRLRDFDDPVRLFQVDVEGLRTEFPPLMSLSARFELLPSERSTFVGRDAEVGSLKTLLATTRLLTMTGPGGTGKTRLALQVARLCEASYAQGVAFVPLAPITDANLVTATIRGALGFAEEPGESSITTLVAKLQHHEMLLILDNFEQVMPAAESVNTLLNGTDQLTVMVTSRASLHIEGEAEFIVPPLGVPDLTGRLDPDDVARTEAVSLFADRAAKVRPGFRIDASNVEAVAAICRHLDGLPLAIELAASRIRLLSPQQLQARLSKRMDILGPAQAGSDRRRTLRGTIDWSHDLLGPSERSTFRRLAIFVGGATLEAIEAVVPTPEAAAGEPADDVLEPLGQLVDHSLVRSMEGDTAPRFLMLETIREYALERLAEAGESGVIAAAHARRYLGRVEALAPAFTADPAALDEIEADHDNVRAALRWAMDEGDTSLAARSVGAMWRFWHLRGHLREGILVCNQMLAMPGASEPSDGIAAALYARASLYYWQGESSKSRADYDASLAAARAAGAPAREAEALFALAYVHMIAKEWAAAHETAQAAAALYEELGDELGNLNARFTDAYASSLEGRWEEAAAGFEGMIDEVEAQGDRFWALNHRITLAWTLIRLGRLDEARTLLIRNLDGSIELGDRSAENMAVQGLAMVAAQQGQIELALKLAGAADRIADELGGKAPDELVVALNPVTVVREGGADESDIQRLTSEGRAIETEAVRSLARQA